GQLADALRQVLRYICGNVQLRPSGGVLRVVVVPSGCVGYLADGASTWFVVSEQSRFQLTDALDGRLDHGPAVVLQRQLESSAQLGFGARLRHADGGAEIGGL